MIDADNELFISDVDDSGEQQFAKFVVRDAPLLVAEFSRSGLSHAYASTYEGSGTRAHDLRALAVQLVGCSHTLGRRFQFLLAKGVCGELPPDRAALSPEMATCADEIAFVCRDELNRLTQLVRAELDDRPACASFLRPTVYLHYLSLALSSCGIKEESRQVIMRTWGAQALVQAMKSTYQSYLRVLGGANSVAPARADFTSTIPLTTLSMAHQRGPRAAAGNLR